MLPILHLHVHRLIIRYKYFFFYAGTIIDVQLMCVHLYFTAGVGQWV